MANTAGFADSVWSDMLGLYAQAGVPELCLTLQDEFDADVPVLLFLLLADHSGLNCRLEDFQRFLGEAAEWQERVVRPLRTVRLSMKTQPMTLEESALRKEIKRIELQAEKLHVARLVAAFPSSRGGHGDLTGRYLAGLDMPEQRCLVTVGMLQKALADCMPIHPHIN